MSNDVSTILVSFGATVNEDSFKKSLSKLQAVLKMAAQEMSAGNKKKSDTYLSVALDDVAKLDKSLKSKIPQIKKEFLNLINTKDSEKNIEALIAKMHVLRAEAAAVAASVEASTSKKSKIGKGVYTDAATETSAYVAYKDKLDNLYEKDLARSKFLRQAYKGTVGGVDKNYPENLAQLKLAAKEFAKYADAEFKFSRSTGKEDWGNKAVYSRVFEGINEKVIRFDKDLGFFTTNMAQGAKALSVTQETLRKTQQKSIDGLAAIEKVLQMDKKSGSGKGLAAVNTLKSVYGKDAAGADVYGGTLLQTMKMMQKPSFGSLGVGGDAASIANAVVQGNITLTPRGLKELKVNNEEGLKALKITEELAIKNGLLSNQYKGVGYDLQKLTAQYNKLSAEQQQAFKATGADAKNVESFKAGMKAVRDASKEAVKDVSGNFDLSAKAVKNFSGIVEKSLSSTQKNFNKIYSEGSNKTRQALDYESFRQGGKDGPQMDTYLKKLKQVEDAIRATSLAKGEDARATTSYYQTANRAVLTEALLARQIEIKGDRLVSTKIKMTDSEKVMNKYRHETDQFKAALEAIMQRFGTFGDPFGKRLSSLKAYQKQIEETANKLNVLGKDGDAWAKSVDLKSVVMGGKGSAPAVTLEKEMEKIGVAFDRVNGKGGILKRSIVDLFEKFKILAGYAISGTIAYGIGNAFKNAVLGVMEFDQALKDLQAITQSTEHDTKRMGDEIFRVATTTKFSVLELAEGMKILGQTGMNASEAINSLEPIAELATATLSDFATINDLVTTTLGSFEFEDDQVGRIVDVFGAAINKSKLNVDKLRVAMNYVGPIAHDAGISLEEVATAMGLFANSGLRASTIGTAFRQIISKLMSPTDDFKEAVLAAGYTMDEINPKTTEFSEIVGKLVHIIPDAENAFKFFGQRASSAISVLTKAGKDGFEEMNAKMLETGLVNKMAQKQMEGLQVMMKNLSDTAGVTSIKIAQAFDFDGMMKGSISFLKSTLSSVLELTAGWGDLVAMVIKVGLVITGLALGFKALTATLPIVGVSAFTLAVGTATKTLGVFLAMLKAPVIAGASLSLGWFVAGLTALTVAVTGVLGVWRPWESALTKNKRDIESQKVATEASTKAHEDLSNTVKQLTDTIYNGKANLDKRITAYLELKNAGADLDDSINSNIDSVKDFDDALEASKPRIDAYIKKVAGMGRELKANMADIRWREWEAANEGIKEGQEGMSRTVLNLDTVIPVEYERSLKQQLEAKQRVEDNLAIKENTSDYMMKMVERIIEEDVELGGRLNAAMASLDDSKIDAALSEILKKASDSLATPTYQLEAYLGDKLDYYKSATAKEVAIEKERQKSLKVLPQLEKNAARSRETALENIRKLGESYGLEQKIFDEQLSAAMASSFGGDAKAKEKEIARLTNAKDFNKETISKQISEQYKVLESAIKTEVDIVAAKRKELEAGLRLKLAGGGITEEEFQQKKQDGVLLLAEQAKAGFEEAHRVIRETGVVSKEMEQDMELIRAKYNADVADALADRAEGMKKIQTSATRDMISKLTNKIKDIYSAYKVALSELDKKETDEIQEASITHFNNERNLESEIFRIKEEFAEKRIDLAKKNYAILAVESAKLAALDKSNTKGDRAEIDLNEEERRIATLRGQKSLDDKKRAVNDAKELREIRYRASMLEVKDIRDRTVREIKMERLRYEQEKKLLDQKLEEGKIAHQNYFEELEVLNKEHLQNMEQLSNTWSDGMTRAMRKYIDSSMNLSTGLENMVSNGFKNMEDSMVQFARTGKLEFASFVDSALSDMARLGTNLVFKSIMKMILGEDGDSTGMGSKSGSGTGGILDQIKAFFGVGGGVSSLASSLLAANPGIGGGAIALASGATAGGPAASLAAAEALTKTTETIAQTSTGFFSGLWEKISSMFGNLSGMLSGFFGNFGSSLTGFFGGFGSTITGWFSNLGSMFTGFFSTMAGWVSSLFGGAGGGIASGIGSFFSFIPSLFGFAEGGQVPGYSPTSTADNIPIWVTAREFIHPVPTVDYYGKGIMEAIRTRSIPREVFTGMAKSSYKSGGSRFAEGGGVEAPSVGTGDSKEAQNLQIVNVLDPGMFDQYMASHAGQKTLMNIISRNPQVIKNIVRD